MSAADWVALVRNELDIDAVGLWQIIATGRQEFGLDGEDLETFVRTALRGLLAKGAIPITGRDKTWVAEHKYGAGPDEIIESVVQVWLSKGMREPDVGDVWFGTTAVLQE
jgi:hypothetical protein